MQIIGELIEIGSDSRNQNAQCSISIERDGDEYPLVVITGLTREDIKPLRNKLYRVVRLTVEG